MYTIAYRNAFMLLLFIWGVECRLELAVMWSFDDDYLNATKIRPNYAPDENYEAELSPLGSNMEHILVPGVQGNAVYVNGKSFNLATGLQYVCLRDPDTCRTGSIMSFQLKIESWNNASVPVIFRTTPEDINSTGMYFGKGEGDEELVIVYRGKRGIKYSKSFGQSYAWNKWAHVVLHWNIFGDIQVVIDSKSLFLPLKKKEETPTPVTIANFVVGSENGPSFYLDEFYVYYGFGELPDTTTTTKLPPTTISTSTPTTTTPSTTTKTTTQSTTTITTPSTTKPTTQSTTTTTPPTTKPTTKSTTSSTTSTTTTSTTQSTSTSTSTASIKSTSSSINATIKHIPATTAKTYWNIWVPILIAFLAVLVLSLCLVWLLCLRHKRRHQQGQIHEEAVAFHSVKGGYERASAAEPYRDDGSNLDTEDTDAEEHNGRLLRSPQPSPSVDNKL